jgi:hypothetical protein
MGNESLLTYLVTAVSSAVLTLVVAYFFRKLTGTQHKEEIRQRDTQIQDFEKQLHLKERDFLDERNRFEMAHLENIKEAKKVAFEEGRQLGLTEGERDHLSKMMTMQAEFAVKRQEEMETSALEAREKLRAEYELQSKLFSVQISPLVRIVEDKGLFSSEFKTEVGYQYQLLINGIPAFQPHLLIERSESRKEINEERIEELTKVARQIAEGAIDMYLGANGQFAKLAMPIVKRLKG